MMKSAYLIIILALIIPFSAFADFKIILKNGREFIVEEYKDVDGKIMFYKWGGEIEIEKDTIEEIKEVKPSKTYDETSPAEVIKEDAPEGRQTPEKSKDSSSNQDIENKLKEIAKKKEEMMTEAEKLNKEKKQLEEDVKKEGMLTTIGRKREMEKRTSEITEKINNFNEELNKLNQEQEKLLKELAPQQK